MKKIALICLIVALSAGTSFAIQLDTVLANTTLSSNMDGTYHANNTATGNASFFQINTAHTRGTTVWGTTNQLAGIYYKAIAGDAYVSTDMPGELTYSSVADDVYAPTTWTKK